MSAIETTNAWVAIMLARGHGVELFLDKDGMLEGKALRRPPDQVEYRLAMHRDTIKKILRADPMAGRA